MTTMVEGYVIREIVDLHPFDRLVLRQRRCDLLNLRRVFENPCVAVHAGTRGGDAGHSRLVGRRVTIQALNLVIPRMNLV